jgi:hypothetical protein
MSLPKQAIEPVPEDTAQVARKAFPKGNPRDLLARFTPMTFSRICIRRMVNQRSDRGDWR